MRHVLLPLLLLLLAPGQAQAQTAIQARLATRSYAIGSFDRIRIEGPFDVRLATGQPPAARAEGDARTLDTLGLRVEGTTLIVRMGSEGWGESPVGKRSVAVITLATPNLRSATVNAGARLTIDKARGQRIDVSITGSGALDITQIDADQLNATIIGSGSMTLSGRAARAQLLTSGTGSFDSSALMVNDLVVRLDGMGQTKAAARYTANVITTGLGSVTVAGTPACTVRALAGGPVSCGMAH